ncbi:zinc-dependent metalloprotease [Flavobacterium sp.]|uniref:zinc-dependent metalloprotease n=1 Tax=Flavobacterium sp. TaxID=239 RepID=UPI0039E545D6
MSFTAITQPEVDLKERFLDYKIFALDDDNLSIADGQQIQIDCQGSYRFVLDESRLLADRYKTIIKTSKDTEMEGPNAQEFEGKYYLNKNLAPDHQVAFSVFKKQYLIYIKENGKAFFLEPLNRFQKNLGDDLYVYYEEKDIIDNGSSICGTDEKNINGKTSEENKRASTTIPNACKTWYLNFAMDYSFYTQYNSPDVALNRTLEILNLSRLNYKIANGLAYDVDFQVLQSFILTCENCNYWPTTNDMSINGTQMQYSHQYTKMFSEVSDSHVFWQGNVGAADFDGLGQLPIPHVCPSEYQDFKSRMAILKNFTDNTNRTRFVLSHELGHNMSCSHRVGTNIMAAGSPPTTTNWHSISINELNTFLGTYTCIYDCIDIACHSVPVQNFNYAVDTTDFTVNLSWVPEENLTYKTRLYNYTTNLWSDYLTHENTVDHVNYSLDATPSSTCSTKYKIQIVPYCDDVSGIVQTTVINVPEACNLSTDHFSVPTVKYYPNPVGQLFHVSAPSLMDKICIYNIVGQKLLELEVKDNNYTVDFSRFEAATYFLRIDFPGGTRNIKVVKD